MKVYVLYTYFENVAGVVSTKERAIAEGFGDETYNGDNGRYIVFELDKVGDS